MRLLAMSIGVRGWSGVQIPLGPPAFARSEAKGEGCRVRGDAVYLTRKEVQSFSPTENACPR